MPTIERTENELAAGLSGMFSEAITHDIELRSQMATIERTEKELVENLYGLLSDAITYDIERRGQLREPLMVPVVIHPHGDEQRRLSGLTRDISTEGIGLVHAFPLECQDVVINVFGPNGTPSLLYVKIEWCDPLGEGWYSSGGRFIYRFNAFENGKRSSDTELTKVP